MASPQSGKKLLRQQEKYLLAEKKELGEFDKNLFPPRNQTMQLC